MTSAIDAAPHGRSGDLHCAIALARQAMQRRDWAGALRWWEAARALAPDHAAGYAGAGNALRELRRFDEAEHVLADASIRFPSHEQVAILRATLANTRSDWPAALGRWADVRGRFPHNPAGFAGTFNALRGAGREGEAAALLPDAEAALCVAREAGADPTACLRLELTIAKVRQDWAVVRQCAEAMIDREAVPSADVHLALAQACWHLGAVEPAGRAARAAIAANPAMAEALMIAAWAAGELGDGDGALECYRRLAALYPNSVRWSLKLVQLLNWQGHVDEAVRELDALCRRWPNDRTVRAFLKNFGPGSPLTRDLAGAGGHNGGEAMTIFDTLLETAPAEAAWKRPLLIPSPEREVEVAVVEGTRAAILVFTGAADGVSMPLALFDRYMATLEATAIYLKDFRRLLYFNGIRSLGEDSAATLNALRTLLSELGATRLATIGNCDGAPAAIRYGLELGAGHILAASPSTHFLDEPSPQLEQGRRFKRTRLAGSAPPEQTDLKRYLECQPHQARIEIIYRAEDEREASHASRIAHVPGVRLHPQPGHPHQPGALHRLALSTPDFPTLLRGWLGLGEAPPAESNFE